MGFPQLILLMATGLIWGWLAWVTLAEGSPYAGIVLAILATSFAGLHGVLFAGGWYSSK